MYGRAWPVRLLALAVWTLLLLPAAGTGRAAAQTQLPGLPVPRLPELGVPGLPELELPPVVQTLLEPPAGGGTEAGAAPTTAPQADPTRAPQTDRGAPPTRRASGTDPGRRPAQAVARAPSRQPSAGGLSRPRRLPAPDARSARRAGRGRGPDRRSRSERSPAEGTGGAGREVSEGGGRSGLERVTDVIETIPKPLLAAVGALALLALTMTARSAIASVRASRLRRQEQELQADVGLLQTALLPTVPERVGEVALSAAWRPAEGPAAGGDFHDLFPLRNGRLGVIVGDVSGHGREALAPTALVHYTVRAYLEAGLPPRRALSLTDEVIGEKLGGSFATVIAAVFDPGDSTLTFATAGHPVPLVLGGGPDHPITTSTPSPIGLGPPTGGRQTRLSIGRGCGVCFFTDGLIEARGHNGLLGREGLAEALKALDGRAHANELLDHLALQTASGGDDMTACLIHPLAASGDGHRLEEIEVERALQRPEQLTRLLTDCGLEGHEAERAVEASQAWPDTATPAILRLDRTGWATRWEIAADDAPPGLAPFGSPSALAKVASPAPV